MVSNISYYVAVGREGFWDANDNDLRTHQDLEQTRHGSSCD